MKSYAQDKEDIILKLMLHNVKKGHYIDIGANDPEYLSVTKLFYDEGWTGINIEPLPDMFEKLCQYRHRDDNLNLAIGNENNKRKLYVNGVLSTFLPNNNPFIWVNVITLEDLYHNYIPLGWHELTHFCKIDVEGHEKEVLQGNNWELFRPWIFCIESTIPETEIPCYQEWEQILLDNDYEFVYEHGINRYYHDRRRLL